MLDMLSPEVAQAIDPDDLNGRVPYQFQAEGISTLIPALKAPGSGFLLADDMGLGKTLQVLLSTAAYGCRAVIVCPAALRYTWVNELFKTLAGKTVCVLNDKTRYLELLNSFGSEVARFQLIPEKADYIIMSYESARTLVQGNPDPHTQHLHKVIVRPEVQHLFQGRTLIFDEGHRSRNPAAKRSQAAFALSRVAERVIAATGTPVDNRPEELWSMLRLTNRTDLFNGKSEFDGLARSSPGMLEVHARLQKSGCFLRRLKKDVLTQLPPKQRQDLVLEMTPKQALLYESARQGLRRAVLNGQQQQGSTCFLAILTAMQTYANECKVVPIFEEIQERFSNGLYTVVSSTRLAPLKEIQTLCAEAGIVCEVLSGETVGIERARVESDFQAGKVHVVLTTLAEGITLTRADEIILLDLPWTPGSTNQREDRIYRIGQGARVTVVRVLAADIDRHKASIITKKQEMIDTMIDGGNSAHANDSIMGEVIKKLLDG